MAKTVAEIAAIIHKDMCEDPANGYSWAPRWGEDGLGRKTLVIDGRSYHYDRGSYDCASSVITAWNEALRYTKYADCLKGATYTGDMLSVFMASGLFDKWDTSSTIAQTGDVYLNYANHTAMCQTPDPDMLSEFSQNEHGGAYGGQVGDQTGWESHICAYYDGSWNCTLHYNGKAEKATPSKKSTGSKVLWGIDVSSNQPKSIVADVPNSFAIIKMSGNPQGYDWNYVNDYAGRQASDAMKKHGLLGLYHFTYGLNDPKREADFFVAQVRKLGYLGRAMLVIDYEAQAVDKGRAWVGKFAARVKELAGYEPVIYASGSVIMSQKLSTLGYPIWCANYYRGYTPVSGYDTSGMSIYSGCEDAVLWQFTSQGYLKGYDGPLDLDCFMGTADDFRALMGPQKAKGHDYRIVKAVNVRRERKLEKSNIVGKLKRGEVVHLKMVKRAADGTVWGHITDGPWKDRVIAVEYKGVKRAERM